MSINKTMGSSTDAQRYDGALIAELNHVLADKADKNRVIFIHLTGNHGWYCYRYPEEYGIFNNPLEVSVFGGLALQDMHDRLNCYDNSVVYNDYVVASLLESTRRNTHVSGFVYFADHADAVFDKLGHNSSNFVYGMTRIPLIFWLSEEYKARYPEKYAALGSNIDKLFSNDDIYDTLIGLFNIETDRYQAVNDLASTQYVLEDKDAYTLHGRILYTDKENYLHHQKASAAAIAASNRTGRVIPKSVNTLGKLADIWRQGYRGIEVYVMANEPGGLQPVLPEVGIGSNPTTLEDLLAAVPNAQMQKVLINLSGVSERNRQQASKYLKTLDSAFDLKDRAVLETDASGEALNTLSQDGWHVSYIIPAAEIAAVLDSSDENRLQAQAAKLVQQIEDQIERHQISAISFDAKYFSFVKSHIEPQLSTGLFYHVKELSNRLYHPGFYWNLSQQDYYADDKVKTISAPHRSPFDL